MPVILQQLRARVSGFPVTVANLTTHTWTFHDQIKQKDNSFFSILVMENPLLLTQYRIQCTHIIHLLDSHAQFKPMLLQGTETALVLAELLEELYSRLDERSNVEQLHHDQVIFRQLLSKRYPQFQTTTTQAISQTIRTLTHRTNLPRATINRIRRMLRSSMLLDELLLLREWIEPLELVINPIFLHLNWIFFIPRLTVNLILLTKHVIPTPWMPEQECLLPWKTRLYVHLNINHRWVELINDFVWCTGNLFSCFLCTGSWAFIDVYFAIGLQLFDLLFTCLYVALEIHRLNTLEKEYQTGCAQGTFSIDHAYAQALQQRITHEKNTGYLAILNHTLLFIAILTILPTLTTISPMAPLVGATLSLLTTIGITFTENYLKQHTQDDVAALKTHRFFKPLSEQFNNVHEKNTLLMN